MKFIKVFVIFLPHLCSLYFFLGYITDSKAMCALFFAFSIYFGIMSILLTINILEHRLEK